MPRSSALGGERQDREALRRWFERLGRLGRNLTITVNDVWVKGLPHNTVVINRWSATDNFPGRPTFPQSGRSYRRMPWGKIVEIDAKEASEAVANMLKRRAAAGVEEALAPQIVN
jgi:hypothetical protein